MLMKYQTGRWHYISCLLDIFRNCSGVGQTGGLPWSVDTLQTKREPIPKGLHHYLGVILKC